jgi:hypothetical protein
MSITPWRPGHPLPEKIRVRSGGLGFALHALTAALFLALAACASAAKFPTHHYIPVSTEVEPWGTLELDDKHLRLEALQGELRLEYVGRFPEMEGNDLSSASVYRVKNGARYLALNSGQRALCNAPPRWLAVSSTSGAPAWSGEIQVALLTLPDWRQFNPGSPAPPNDSQPCASGRYILASGEAP